MSVTAIGFGLLCIVLIAPLAAPSSSDQLREAMRADATGTRMQQLDDNSGTWRTIGWVTAGVGVVLGVGGLAAPMDSRLPRN